MQDRQPDAGLKNNFCKSENSSLRKTEIVYTVRHPGSARGADASSRALRRDAMDACGSPDERHPGGRPRRVVLVPRRWDQVSRDGDVGPSDPTRRDCREATEAIKPGIPRRARYRPLKPIAQGRPGRSG